MAQKTSNRAILITGGLSDIGQATAREFAGAGYSLVLNYRHRPEKAAQFADALRREYGSPRVSLIRADIRNRNEVKSLFDQAFGSGDHLEILVNNAGINRDRSFLEMSDDEWDTVVSTILGGTFMCSQEFARRYGGREGNIINIGSVSAVRGRKNGANYCSARSGILALTKCMALELAPHIRVNTITPGRMDTEELRARYKYVENNNREDFERDIPLGKMGTPEDIAQMIVFLVEKGKYITGQNFFIDGGLLMR